jgi:hypothetical protein
MVGGQTGECASWKSVSDTALGSDVMVAALEGYSFLKAAGKAEGVDGLRKLLSRRFEGNGRKAETVVAPVAEPA